MKKKFKKALPWIGVMLVAVLVIAIGIVTYVYQSAKQTVSAIYEPRKAPAYLRSGLMTGDAASVEDVRDPRRGNGDVTTKPFTVLLLGVDRREQDVGRSDTIVVMGVNPGKKTISLFSIPRDTRTEIVGRGTTDKINHAFAFGGVDMSLQTVEKFLDFPIDYFVQVDMEEFSRIIDTIGGVEVNNPFPFTMSGQKFGKGRLKLSGSEALLYSRMRYDDPKGDLGRNARQRELIAGLIRKTARVKNIFHTGTVLEQMEKSVRTNMKFEFIQSCLYDRMDQYSLTTKEIKGKGMMMNGIWYYLVDDRERHTIHEYLKSSLNAA